MSGQGRAPRSREAIDWYLKNGIPGDGDMKMAPVPAVVDLCITVLKRYGSMSFEEIIAPALALLDRGKDDWHPRLAITLRKLIAEERLTSGSRAEKLQAVADRFYGRNAYRNDIAEALEAFFTSKKGAFSAGKTSPRTSPHSPCPVVEKLCRIPKLQSLCHTQSNIWNVSGLHRGTLLIGRTLQFMDFTVSKLLLSRQHPT